MQGLGVIGAGIHIMGKRGAVVTRRRIAGSVFFFGMHGEGFVVFKKRIAAALAYLADLSTFSSSSLR